MTEKISGLVVEEKGSQVSFHIYLIAITPDGRESKSLTTLDKVLLSSTISCKLLRNFMSTFKSDSSYYFRHAKKILLRESSEC